ncbi:MAG: LacI family DNA-binding transcriptional regulator [Mycobacteriaceae bacterium]
MAADVGVSQATVSRALRNDPSVAEKTRLRVQEAARRLGYVPNDLGRSFKNQATHRIAFVADLDNPLWSLLVAQAHDELADHGYTMTLLAEHGDPVKILTYLAGGWADAVIISSARLDAQLPQMLSRRGVPFVLVNRTLAGTAADAVVADNIRGGRAAAQLLIEAGHTRVGALFGPPETSTGRDRELGFREGLAQGGVSLPKSRVLHGEFDYAFGRTALSTLLRGRYRPTAVFCTNDIIAVGAINAAHELGLRIPDDLALTGFDDLEEASWPVYNLTTMKVPFDAMLSSAIRMLLNRLAGDDSPAHVDVHAVTPVLRGTHAMVRGVAAEMPPAAAPRAGRA